MSFADWILSLHSLVSGLIGAGKHKHFRDPLPRPRPLSMSECRTTSRSYKTKPLLQVCRGHLFEALFSTVSRIRPATLTPIVILFLRKMVFNATVLYPASADLKFDLSYYLKTHMPLVKEKWGPYGLKEWKVVQFDNSPADGSKTYSFGAILTWEDADSVKKALGGEEAKIVFGDVQNFSNVGPLFLAGEIVGSSS